MKITTEKISILRTFLVTQMNHWVFFPVYVAYFMIMEQEPHILIWLVFGSIPFLLYLVRKREQKLWLSLLFHLIVLLIMCLLPATDLTIRIFYLLVGGIYVIYSCYLNVKSATKQDPVCYPLFSIAVSVAMLYFLQLQGHHEWSNTFVITLIVIIGLYFIIYYMEQYLNFLKVNHSSAGHIPSGEMFRSGMGLALGYTTIGILVLILISNLSWLRSFLSLFKNGLRSIMMLLFSNVSTAKEEVASKSNTTVNAMPDFGGMQDSGEPFWLWTVLEYVIEALLLVIILVAVIRLLFFLFRFIKNRVIIPRKLPENNTDSPVVDVREKCDIIKRNRRKQGLPFLPGSPEERIRQLYKKCILASEKIFENKNKASLSYYTARESSQLLAKNELASIYEKARYSKEECNNDDVRRMRNACK